MNRRLRATLLVLFFAGLISMPVARAAPTCSCCSEPDHVQTMQLLLSQAPALAVPAMTTPDTGHAVEVRLRIDLSKRTITVLRGDKIEATFRVGIGKPKTPSPVGTFSIRRKASGWGGGFGVRFLELDVPWGVFGIHGTNKPYSVGGRLSGGCFRMHNQDVARLYSMVKVGTQVEIVDPANGHHFLRGLSVGSRGSDVYLLQQGLAELGYLDARPDGIYGSRTASALMRFQAMHGLRPTGRLDEATAEMARLRIVDGWPSFDTPAGP